jgi:beta-mannosidase
MKQHQKSYVGNGMMKKHADLLFGESTDFKTFVYYSQLVQAEGVESAIAAHRLDYPRCGGTLYWQFNDCWPASTWSSIDYFGNWKALHYRVKTSFEPVAVLQAPLDSSTFFLVSDVSKAFTSNLSCSVYDLSGELLEQIYTSIDLSTPVRMRLFENELAKWKNQSVLYQFAWTNHEYKQKTQSFRKLAVDFKSNKNLVPTIQVALENIDETNKKATLILETDTYLMDFWIYSLQQGVTFSNNFCDFLPGKHAIQISFDSLPKLSDFQYQFR